MFEIQLSLLALSNAIDIKIQVEFTSSALAELSHDLFELFASEKDVLNQKIILQSVQQKTTVLLENVRVFIEKYKRLTIAVYQLQTYLQRLPDSEYFILHIGSPPTREAGLQYQSRLYGLKHGKDADHFLQIYNSILADFVKKYEVYSFNKNDKKRSIGEQDKTKRICRFCNNERDTISFKNTSHAISESLGNKSIILNEECDACNWEFGTSIESELTAYLKLYANIFNVKGKNGVPKYKGKNFFLSNNEDGHLDLHYFVEDEKEKGTRNLKLKTFDSISLQNIYRSLCKYAISVIDNELLQNFKGTIEWIKQKENAKQLPLVAVLTSYKMLRQTPSITVSIRRDKDYTYPYAIGEFRYTFLTFVYIIPFTTCDTQDFTNESNYKRFWDFCKHYNSANEWKFEDFSESMKKEYVVYLEVETTTKYSIGHSDQQQ